MRVAPFILAVALAGCSPDPGTTPAAGDMPAPPNIPEGLPYPEARTRMIAAGFEPVKVFQRRRETECGEEDTPCYPELMDCGAGAGWLCDWLYRRRADGALFSVETWPTCDGEGGCSGPAFSRIRPIEPHELDEYVFAKRDGRPDKTLPPQPPPPPEPPGAPRLPEIDFRLGKIGPPEGVSYPEARRMLAAQGFEPVHIVSRLKPELSGYWTVCDSFPARCRAFPEVIDCSGTGGGQCSWLFRKRTDGRYWLIFTLLDEGKEGDDQLRCCGWGAAQPRDLDNLEILRADGSRYRFAAAQGGE